jgi:hypothetical protein
MNGEVQYSADDGNGLQNSSKEGEKWETCVSSVCCDKKEDEGNQEEVPTAQIVPIGRTPAEERVLRDRLKRSVASLQENYLYERMKECCPISAIRELVKQHDPHCANALCECIDCGRNFCSWGVGFLLCPVCELRLNKSPL